MARASDRGTPPSVGAMLQHWRQARSLSQLALAHEASVSPRHVSFVETGRSTPSREMVLRLAEVLEIPLRERNALLLAAGFAPMFRASALGDAELAPVRAALDALLRQHEPYPTVVLNRQWDIVETNAAAARFFALLFDGRTPQGAGNVLRLMFHPDGLRPCVGNWEAVARALLLRVHREALGGVLDDAGRALLAEVLGYPGVPRSLGTPDVDVPLVPVVPVDFRHRTRTFRFFSAVTVLGTPQDVTAQEVRLETFFPFDADTDAAVRDLARSALLPVSR